MESLQALRASSENTEPTSTSHHTRTRAELPRQLRPFHLGRPQAHRSTQRAQGQTLLKRVYGCPMHGEEGARIELAGRVGRARGAHASAHPVKMIIRHK